MRKIVLIKILIFLTLFSCKKSNNTQSKLVYNIGNQKIEIEISNRNNYLEYNKPTITDFILTNIEPNKFSVSGCGIRMLKVINNKVRTEINVPNQCGIENKLNIKVKFEDKYHQFNVPVK